jgi:hypothetical protein
MRIPRKAYEVRLGPSRPAHLGRLRAQVPAVGAHIVGLSAADADFGLICALNGRI